MPHAKIIARLDAPGVLDHVIIRGIERRNIFEDNKDRGTKGVRSTLGSCLKWEDGKVYLSKLNILTDAMTTEI